MTFNRVWACALVLFAGSLVTHTAEAADAERGKTLAYTCLGCHGVVNYKNVYPTYDVPSLHGQHPEYLVAALKGYKSGERSHATMHAHASSMSDEDMADIAAYLAGTPLKTAGKALPPDAPKAAATCFSCHGADGVGITPDYPTLAGQHEDYLERALEEYKKGGRRNPIMAGFAAALKDSDIKELAEYYSKQKPKLEVLPRPTSILSKNK
jgi:cytochrome c553